MIKGTKDEVRDKLRGRVVAYGHVFDPNNQFTRTVLLDLAKFCMAHETTYQKDPNLPSIMLEGRRQVWLRIQNYLKLDIEEIYQLHNIRE